MDIRSVCIGCGILLDVAGLHVCSETRARENRRIKLCEQQLEQVKGMTLVFHKKHWLWDYGVLIR
jgi:hypothetical protein